ncbi:uncharacterized protein LOC108049693 [Drosophila rhopaloa]|uniref:Uncharacterized protein LOC108049693 n=1 Tax=Drosophila rhopaloa TaxID=1041015 RepID=A0A6P4F7P8_DRORH|nr:uncharacterized protein LOC108049693 [Drosophila rhopaloa]
MCSNLGDLFACIRAQGDSDADTTSTTHQRSNADVDDEALDPRSDLFRRQQRKGHRKRDEKSPRQDAFPAASPSAGCHRPPSRNSRVSYEVLERYDQICGGSLQEELGVSRLSRHIPDQF